MSKLDAFLHPVTTEKTEKIVISDRFVDENGKPVPFTIKSITQAENDAIIKRCTRRIKSSAGEVEKLDKEAYNSALVLKCVAEPDMSQKEMCDAYGVVDPSMVPARMLLTGEFALLTDAIMKICGFVERDSAEYEEAKN